MSFQSPTTASTIKHYSQEVCESLLGSASEAQNLLPPRNQQAILSYPRQTIPTLFIRSKLTRLVRYVLVMFQFHLAIRSFPQILMVNSSPNLSHIICVNVRMEINPQIWLRLLHFEGEMIHYSLLSFSYALSA